jgi:hypothetical protein
VRWFFGALLWLGGASLGGGAASGRLAGRRAFAGETIGARGSRVAPGASTLDAPALGASPDCSLRVVTSFWKRYCHAILRAVHSCDGWGCWGGIWVTWTVGKDAVPARVRGWYPLVSHSPHSSGERATASGAVSAGSNPAGGASKLPAKYPLCRARCC